MLYFSSFPSDMLVCTYMRGYIQSLVDNSVRSSLAHSMPQLGDREENEISNSNRPNLFELFDCSSRIDELELYDQFQCLHDRGGPALDRSN